MIDITTWMNDFLQKLNLTFENRVWFVGLQGSYGRGEATETSDIDIVVILDELSAKEHKLFYWRGKASAELEFIIESDNKLYPIDVKKGRGTLNSLEKFSNHNKFEYAIKVSKNNYGYNPEQKLLTIPFYFIPFVAKDLADGTMGI